MAPAARFRGLALVATALDARAGVRLTRARRRMSEPELDEMLRSLDRLPLAVEEWSEGNAAFREWDVRVLDEPVRRLARTGGDRWWVAPESVIEILEPLAPRGRWDSVFLVYPTDGSFAQCGWACSVGPTELAGGAGWSAITSDRWEADRHRLFPEEGFVHEWLHQVEGMYRLLGLGRDSLPDLHDVADRGTARDVTWSPYGDGYVPYEQRTGTWQPWYRDLMTGTVGPKGDERPPVGLTRQRWALRGDRR